MFKQFTILLFNVECLTVRKQRDRKKERSNAECQSIVFSNDKVLMGAAFTCTTRFIASGSNVRI